MLSALLQVLNFLIGRILPQFFLDGLQLLLQEVLPLLLVNFGLNLILDVVLQLHHLVLVVELLQNPLALLLQICKLQQLLLIIDLHVQVGGNEIQQEALAFDIGDSRGSFVRNVRGHLHDLLGQLPHVGDHGLHFLGIEVLGRFFLAVKADCGLQVWVFLRVLLNLEALLTLNDHRQATIRHLQ